MTRSSRRARARAARARELHTCGFHAHINAPVRARDVRVYEHPQRVVSPDIIVIHRPISSSFVIIRGDFVVGVGATSCTISAAVLKTMIRSGPFGNIIIIGPF